jgi:hypothetical protein
MKLSLHWCPWWASSVSPEYLLLLPLLPIPESPQAKRNDTNRIYFIRANTRIKR